MKMKSGESAAFGKNCLSCTRCETVFDTRTGKEWHRCSLDRDMRVNRRMHCDEWTMSQRGEKSAVMEKIWERYGKD